MAYRMTHEIEIEARAIGMEAYKKTKSRIQAQAAYGIAKDRMYQENIAHHAIRDAGSRQLANTIGYVEAFKRQVNNYSWFMDKLINGCGSAV